MTKKRTDPEQSQDLIIRTALELVRRDGARRVTVAAVASAAGCAKGLVHYHFKTKRRLWDAVTDRLATERESRWRGAFAAPTPKAAIDRTWALLVEESVDGTMLAWTTLLGPEGPTSDPLASERLQQLSATLGVAAAELFRRYGMRMRIPATEVGWLLGSVIAGVGLSLLGGADRSQLEGAYAAAWLGILSLSD